MKAVKRILVPTDFSDGAGQALRYAVMLADRLAAELHLLHVVTGPLSVDGGMMGFPEMEAVCTDMRREAARCHRGLSESEYQDQLPLQCAVRRHTEAAQAILEYATDHTIDLIVMAPYGHRRGKRIIVGRTAEKVVRLAPCDVLTSGLGGVYTPDLLGRILAPIDFSPPSALALERARMLAKQTGAHLTVLHVVKTRVFPGPAGSGLMIDTRKTQEEIEADLELFYRYTKGPDVTHRFHVLRGGPADRIAAFARRHRMHLVVQGSLGRSGIAYAMLGSVAEAIVRLAPCPVLTVKKPMCDPVSPSRRNLEHWKRNRPSPRQPVSANNLNMEEPQ